jgi:putative addiction module antidote
MLTLQAHPEEKHAMVQKIFRSGNSLVVSLPKDILDMLGLDEGAEVSVEIDREQRRIIITPAGLALPGVNEEFARQVTEFIEQYRPALEALARR